MALELEAENESVVGWAKVTFQFTRYLSTPSFNNVSKAIRTILDFFFVFVWAGGGGEVGGSK